MTHDPIVIVGARRTPMGGFQGELAGLTAAQLGSAAIRAALAQAGVPGESVERGVMGCVLGAGQGQAPARQALLGAGLPQSCAAVTVNKMCGSGMQAAIDAHDALVAGSADIMIAGGMESMTNAPYLLAKARGGFRMGHGEIKDSMFLDGLEDAYETGRLMGSFAEDTARDYQFTRAAQDEWAIRSTTRAQSAIASGAFDAEVTPVTVKGGEARVDEQPGKARLDKIPTLKPAFAKDGTVTAANASSISDGAAALILTRASVAAAHGLTPLARILGHSVHAQAPSAFATAPAPAIRKLLEKTGLSVAEIDLWEINEAFAVVAMAAVRDLGLDEERVNIHGGACALGHPIGASGARILVTLLHALQRTDKRLGVASLCIGGGEATAMAIERLN
ncbi:acetyl-CoA C-acyltransferase [Glacieibacterium frigidum]|uniref:Acetyl-CoA C-acyltransferase n=1 Tax=Glacieibacterium frigidum TaxID=2593303 RepID=A0A552UFZ6_9SPHN|nr:acetyl-CoA C-acyltransferase [Glacieibacterium frigidum]TRW17143.1 acetyl-CoA C-acyltransferase [Glacieibacterium frigidum]